MPTSKIPSPEYLKKKSKKLRDERGIKLADAQKELVNQFGFNSFPAYRKAYEKQKTENLLLSNDPKVIFNENRKYLVSLGIDFTVFIPTDTALKKSIIDATAPVRSLFEDHDYHHYGVQEQGPDYKVKTDAYLIEPASIQESQASLYRPVTKKGDPRMWFKHLPKYADPNDKIAIIFKDNSPYLLNLSKEIISQNGFIRDFLETILKDTNSIANELLSKLKAIAKNGPLKAIKHGDTAIGMTIEHALGIDANSSKEPDYNGIELKSTRNKGKANRVTLFAQVANWKKSPLKSSREILDSFGYERDDDFKLYCTISTLVRNSNGLQFEVRDDGNTLAETHEDFGDVAYWDASMLKKRLKEKHAETFWIKADTIKENGDEFFQLKSVVHTKSPLTNQLLPLIEEGVITMDHLIKKSGKTGRVSEKGPLFKIKPEAMALLFPEPVTYNLLEEN